MELKKEKKLSSKLVYANVLHINLDEVLLPNGKIEKREYLINAHPVCILAINDKNEVLFERQYRYPFDEFIYELPAGKIEKGELPIDAAKREFEEETGYITNNITTLGSVYPNVGYSTEIVDIFLATNLVKKQQHLDDGENINIEFISIDKVIEMINDGTIKEGRSIAAMFYYLNCKAK